MTKSKSGTNLIRMRFRLLLPLVSIMAFLVLFGQQCSRVQLELSKETEFSSSTGNPFLLDPPREFPIIRRFIIMIDMSNSMISGPCPQDVNNLGRFGDGGLFSTTPTYSVYDPNLGKGNSADHRGDGVDCKVDPSLPFQRTDINLSIMPNVMSGIFYKSTRGVDFEGYRISIVRKWIDGLRTYLDDNAKSKTSLMLVPVTGGTRQKLVEKLVVDHLNSNSTKTIQSPLQFLNIQDSRVDLILDKLLLIQNEDIIKTQSNDEFRYDDTRMGTSDIGSILDPVQKVINQDMKSLNQKGQLSFAEYDLIHLSDGYITPVAQNFRDVLDFSAQCSSCNLLQRGSCNSVCSQLITDMETAWGSASANEIGTLDFKFGLIQALPYYFGTGYLRTDFVQLNKNRALNILTPQDDRPYFDRILPFFESKNHKAVIWNSLNDNIPFSLSGSTKNSVSYKMTNLYVINPNVRIDKKTNKLNIDSDGDGLFDDEEQAFGTNSINPRSNGFCYDGMLKSSSYGSRCESMVQLRSCDPSLDSDGDSLNECEENLLGTDPFDFDTDGDTIPDYFEWLYSFNPLVSDIGKDSAGDGVPNLVKFSSGVSPNLTFSNIPQQYLIKYEVNSLGKGSIPDNYYGEVWVDYNQLLVHQIPTLNSLTVNEIDISSMYSSKLIDPSIANQIVIPNSHQLLTYPTLKSTNRVIAMARMIDRDDPSRVFWKVYKGDVYVGQGIKQPQLDLSQFRQIKAMDRN